VPTLEEL